MSWDNLSPKQLGRRAERVRQYSRSMGDFGDGETFRKASDLDDLLGGREPSEVDALIEDGRKRIQHGESLGSVAQSIAARLSALPNDPKQLVETNRARLIEKPVRAALAQNVSLAEAVKNFDEENAGIPDEEERQAIRYARETEAIRFSRAHGHPQPPEQQYGRAEINRAGVLMSQRKGLTFDKAIEMVRTGH